MNDPLKRSLQIKRNELSINIYASNTETICYVKTSHGYTLNINDNLSKPLG